MSDQEMPSFQVAPFLEITPNEYQIYQVTGTRFQISFAAIFKFATADFDYISNQMGKPTIGAGPAKDDDVQKGLEQIANIRAVINSNPAAMILDEEAKYGQLVVTMSDALDGLSVLVSQANSGQAFDNLDPLATSKLLPIMELQYQHRTGRMIHDENNRQNETETAKQIRLAYTQLLELVRKR